MTAVGSPPMSQENTRQRDRHPLQVLMLVAAVLVLAAGCKSLCYKRVQPDGTVDFSSLRLSGRLLCNPSATCLGTFSGDRMELAFLPDQDLRRTYKDVLTYAVLYEGTHVQTQNVLETSAELESCGEYRRESWTVPTVTMRLLSATRDGQQLTVGSAANQLDPDYQELSVKAHYVERQKGNYYYGVELCGPRSAEGWYPVFFSLTKDGNDYHFLSDNP
jgi:hypothetical protein